MDQDDPYRVFRSAFESKAVRSAWIKSYGDQFWEASEPPLSQATIDDIKFLTERLRPGSETKLADFGCGSGCVGRYLAKEFDTSVEGIDANPLAIRLADELTVSFGTAQRLRFKTADISDTGWSDHSFDGALSMDVLLFVPDKRAALREVARILKLGGRFVGTTWELRADSAALSAPAFDAYPSAFERCGLHHRSLRRDQKLEEPANRRPRSFGGIGGRGTKGGRRPQGRLASGVGSNAPRGT